MAGPSFGGGGYMPCPALSTTEMDNLKRIVETTTAELVAYAALEGGPVQWKPRGVEDNLHVYEGTDTTGPTDERVWCAKSQMQASIEEVQLMTYTENSEDYKLFCEKFMVGVLDAARLYNVVEPTEKRPLRFVGINWLLQKSPSKGLIRSRDRDWCFVEGHLETEMNGRRAWVRSFTSVNLPCCPDLRAKCGYARASHYRSGILFVETDRPGYLSVTQYNHDVVKGESHSKMTDWLYSSTTLARYRKLLDLEVTIRKYRLSNITFLPLSRVVPPGSRHFCNACDKLFGNNKKLHCRKCGEVVCRNCSKIYELNSNGQWGEFRVCEPCVFGKVETRTKMNSVISFRSDESSVRQQPSSTWDSEEDNESSYDSSRGTLIDESFDMPLNSSFVKPTYKPAMAAKFTVDAFFSEPQRLEPPRVRKQ